MLIHWSLETQNRKQNKLAERQLSKPLPTMCILVQGLSKCYDYFLRFSGFLGLFGKVFMITFKFS